MRGLLTFTVEGMSTASQTLWVGAINGVHVVFDPQIQINGSRWVLLYLVAHGKVVAYRRRHARTVVQRHAREHPQREANLAHYRSWRLGLSAEALEALREDLRRKDATLEQEIASTEQLHKRFLSLAPTAYPGTREPSGTSLVRSAECLQCHRALGSDLNIECNTCHWMVCRTCGACGCRFTSRIAHDAY